MRAIAQPFYDASAHLLGPTSALLFFVGFFVVASVLALRARGAELDRAAALPLEDRPSTRSEEPTS